MIKVNRFNLKLTKEFHGTKIINVCIGSLMDSYKRVNWKGNIIILYELWFNRVEYLKKQNG